MAILSLHFLPSITDSPYNTHLSYFFLLLPILFLFAGYTARRKKSQSNLPPSPAPSLPFIGHIPLLRSTPHITLHHLSRKYGPLIRLNLGLEAPTIVASSPETAAKILKTNDTLFCSRPSLTSTNRFSYGSVDIAFSPYNDHWKQLRHFAGLHLFSPSTVRSLCAVREQEVEAMVKALSINSSSTVNVSEVVMSLLNNITFREVFGRRPVAGNDGEYGMKSPYHELITEMVAFMGEFCWGDLFPSLGWVDKVSGWKGRLERRFLEMDVVFEEEIAERVKGRGRHEGDCCFTDLLLRHLNNDQEKNGSLELQLSMDELKAVLMNLFIGGIDTSAATLEWAMTRLIKNPKVMRKAQEEVRQVVGHKAIVKESDLQELHYLKMVIKETLRLHPPAPLLLQRECLKDTIIEGYNIPAKARVLINAWSIGRDARHWDSPEDFRPERFEGSPISYKGSHFELIPFGAGRRICPGLALGIVGIELAMANLLYCFNWELPEGKREEDVCLDERFGIVSHKKEPLLLVPTCFDYKELK